MGQGISRGYATLLRSGSVRPIRRLDLPGYELAIDRPVLDVLRTRGQLRELVGAWRSLLSAIVEVHGRNAVIHLCPAVPNALAVEMGRSLLEGVDPKD